MKIKLTILWHEGNGFTHQICNYLDIILLIWNRQISNKYYTVKDPEYYLEECCSQHQQRGYNNHPLSLCLFFQTCWLIIVQCTINSLQLVNQVIVVNPIKCSTEVRLDSSCFSHPVSRACFWHTQAQLH